MSAGKQDMLCCDMHGHSRCIRATCIHCATGPIILPSYKTTDVQGVRRRLFKHQQVAVAPSWGGPMTHLAAESQWHPGG
jgi:hypothetical protein